MVLSSSSLVLSRPTVKSDRQLIALHIVYYILLETITTTRKKNKIKRPIATEPENTPLNAAYPRTWLLAGRKPGANTYWRTFDLPPIRWLKSDIFFLFGSLSNAEILKYIRFA